MEVLEMSTEQKIPQRLAAKLIRDYEAFDDVMRESYITTIEASIPPSLRGNYSADKYLAADEYYDTWRKSQETGEVKTPNADETKKSEKESMPTTTFTQEQKDAVQNVMAAEAPNIAERTNATKLVAVLYDQPTFGTTIKEGAMLLPTMDAAKIKKLRDKECVTEDDAKKRDQMIAAAEAKQPMAVYVNTEARPKIIGYSVQTKNDQMQDVHKIMDKDEMLTFLCLKVSGYIPNNKTQLGARVSMPKSSSSANNENGSKKKRLSIRLVNRDLLNTNPATAILTSDFVKDENGNREEVQKAAKSQDYFMAYGNGATNKGERRKVKCRISGETTVYKVERLEEYANKFNILHKNKNEYRKASADEERKYREIRDALILGSDFGLDTAELASLRTQVRKEINSMRPNNGML